MWQWWQSAARTAASPKVTPKRPFHYWIIRGSTETALRNWPTGASRTRHPATTSFHVHLPPLALLHQPFPHVTTIWGGLQVALALLNQFQQSGSEGQRSGLTWTVEAQPKTPDPGLDPGPTSWRTETAPLLFFVFHTFLLIPVFQTVPSLPPAGFTAASSMRILRSSQRLFQSKTRDQRRQQAFNQARKPRQQSLQTTQTTREIRATVIRLCKCSSEIQMCENGAQSQHICSFFIFWTAALFATLFKPISFQLK